MERFGEWGSRRRDQKVANSVPKYPANPCEEPERLAEQGFAPPRSIALSKMWIDHGFEPPETPVMALHRGRLDLLEAHLARARDLFTLRMLPAQARHPVQSRQNQRRRFLGEPSSTTSGVFASGTDPSGHRGTETGWHQPACPDLTCAVLLTRRPLRDVRAE